jgi:hypothetical protein
MRQEQASRSTDHSASTGPTIRHSFLENIHAPNSAWAATRLAIQPQWTSIVLSRVDLIPPNALDYHRDIAKRLNRRSDRVLPLKEHHNCSS